MTSCPSTALNASAPNLPQFSHGSTSPEDLNTSPQECRHCADSLAQVQRLRTSFTGLVTLQHCMNEIIMRELLCTDELQRPNDVILKELMNTYYGWERDAARALQNLKRVQEDMELVNSLSDNHRQGMSASALE
uniref:Uncharacterized protein n=1 Tax=Mycena chlorophos TaxID=658473 RepID=A0ABQ0L0N2_MYCCL|nr:predicted protein [Mycena chlorophos]